MIAWVMYDITDNLVRNRIAGICLDYGLVRLQKSIFSGETDEKTLARIGERICGVIGDCPGERSVLIFSVCDTCMKNRISLGSAFDSLVPERPRLVIIG